MAVLGLDVYSGTGPIKWDRVAAAGKKCVFIRGSYGDETDTMASRNFKDAKGEGLLCGIYHFYRQTRSLQSQITALRITMRQVN
jgi:GH25 family lysozyme M1 (1,4-beta-N-acetylmuramidase)